LETLLKFHTPNKPNIKEKIPPREIDEKFTGKKHHQRNTDLEPLSPRARLLPKLPVTESLEMAKKR
jgi:hypothetical protein